MKTARKSKKTPARDAQNNPRARRRPAKPKAPRKTAAEVAAEQLLARLLGAPWQYFTPLQGA